MIGRVLVSFTDSEEARQALEYVLRSFSDAEITVIHVGSIGFHFGHGGPDWGYVEAVSGDGKRLLKQAEKVASEHGRSIEIESLQGRPAHEIIAYAEESESDHIVMGTQGRSTEKIGRVPRGRTEISDFRDDERRSLSNHLTPR